MKRQSRFSSEKVAQPRLNLRRHAEIDAEMLTLPEQVKRLVERSKPKEEETAEEPQGGSAEESSDR